MSDIFLNFCGPTEENTKYFRQDRGYPGGDFNRALPEYAESSLLEATCSVSLGYRLQPVSKWADISE
jgi:hypothetical protein